MSRLSARKPLASLFTAIFCSAAVLASAVAAAAAQDVQTEAVVEKGALMLAYTGPVAPGMASFIAQEFLKNRNGTNRVVLILNSGGGSVEEGEQVIALLKEIRHTHRLDTVVLQGSTCASMCVPIFLQGKDRHVASASIWVFHEVTAQQRANMPGATEITADEDETFRLFREYYIEAGVSPEWIKQVLNAIVGGKNLWLTGSDSGLVEIRHRDRPDREHHKPAGTHGKAAAAAQRGPALNRSFVIPELDYPNVPARRAI